MTFWKTVGAVIVGQSVLYVIAAAILAMQTFIIIQSLK